MEPRGGVRKMQRLQSGGRCEEVGCYKEAEWLVNFGEVSFHWCPKHTMKHMRDRSFWQLKLAHLVGR